MFMVVCPVFQLTSQPQTTSPVAERIRQRKLTANEKAAELFFQRNLPPGWVYDGNEQQATLRRLAPVYTLTVPAEDYLTHSKARLLDRARKSGKKHTCEIKIKVERHDDPTRMRQKLRLYENVRRDIVSAWNRLQVRRLCADRSVEDCGKNPGPAGEAAREYLVTRGILADKLELVPFYRIGTLYFFPQKNQCVTAPLDWYFTNTGFPANEAIFPIEAREEIELILRNMEQLRLSP